MSGRLKNLLLALIIPFVLLVIFEGGGRIVLDIKPNAHSLYIDHPYLITTPKPNEKLGFININSQGYRGKEIVPCKSSQNFRIVCLGGSATFCGNVPDNETWCQILEDRLNRKQSPNLKFEVINAGVPGYTTAESMVNLSLRIIDLNPDVVIVYHSYNDYKPNRHPNFKPDYSHWRKAYGKIEQNFINKIFVTPRTFQEILSRLFPDSKLKDKRFDTVSEEGLEAYRRNLLNIIAIANSRNIHVILASEATILSHDTLKEFLPAFKSAKRFVPNLTELGLLDAIKKYDKSLRDVALHSDTIYVDTLNLVPKDWGHFIDHIHLTAKGCRVVAEHFAIAIERNFIITSINHKF